MNETGVGQMDAPDSQQGQFRRKQIIVDRQFQLQYMYLWLAIGAALFVVSVIAFLIYNNYIGKDIPPLTRNVALGMSVFVLLFCFLMGLLSIVLTHRVAGASYRIKMNIDEMLAGQLGGGVKLRKNDYLQDLAERVGDLSKALGAHKEKLDNAVSVLKELREKLPEADRPKIDEAIANLSALYPIKSKE